MCAGRARVTGIVRVVVLGAGFSGLAAALAQAGVTVMVLEVRDRVGGRVLTGGWLTERRCIWAPSGSAPPRTAWPRS